MFSRMEGSEYCPCCTKVGILRCRKSELFSEERQTLPQPLILAEILKQPLRAKQKSSIYGFVDLTRRQVLSLSVLGSTKQAVLSTDQSQGVPSFPYGSRVAQTPAPSLKILLGKPKQTGHGQWAFHLGGTAWHHPSISNMLLICLYWLVKRIIY